MPKLLKPFEYLEPRSTEEAMQLLLMHGNKAKVLAGGLDLIPRIRQGKSQPDYIVSNMCISNKQLSTVKQAAGVSGNNLKAYAICCISGNGLGKS